MLRQKIRNQQDRDSKDKERQTLKMLLAVPVRHTDPLPPAAALSDRWSRWSPQPDTKALNFTRSNNSSKAGQLL